MTTSAPGRGAQAPPARPPPHSPARAPLTRRLGVRLSSLFAVALLPLGIISLVQAGAWLDAARSQATAALMGETLRAAAGELRVVNEARGAAAALAQTLQPLLGDERACDAAVSHLAGASPQYSLVAYVPPDGRMRCASEGAAYDFADSPRFRRVLDARAPFLTVNPRGPVSGTSVIGVSHPVLAERGGGYAGFVTLSMPHTSLARVAAEQAADPAGRLNAPDNPGLPSAPDFVTFDGEGVVLTASQGFERADENLPVDRPLLGLAGPQPASFAGVTAGGQERFYAVVPLIEGQLYALGSVPARQAVTLGPIAIVAPFLTAALMWGASLVVAWVAAERLVTRHIRRLSRAIAGFAGGSRVVGDLDMERAPAEIREAGEAFIRMTDTILHDEAELENTVHQREVLLREVHHRVKNNLQLIASIMNMQMRRTRSPETRSLMLGLQERVMSLATVHKELYQTTELADVRADELLGDITRQIVAMSSGPGRRFRVDTDFAPVRLTPDQAVPLSLLLTEALTNAIKHAEVPAGEKVPRLSLSFREAGPERAEIAISNSAAPGGGPGAGAEAEAGGQDGREEGPGRTGLGGQLIAAFAAQLGGEAQVVHAGGTYVLRLDFALSPLAGGEERRAAAPPAPRAGAA